MNDEFFMRRALQLAQQAANEGETPVGCVIVWNGAQRSDGAPPQVVAEGYNKREHGKNALYHAEIEAIDLACKRLGGWRLWQCELFVTLEPCPMCAGAIINARIPRVVFGAADPKAGCCGSVIDLFAQPFNHKPKCEGGLLADESAALLKDFFAKLRG